MEESKMREAVRKTRHTSGIVHFNSERVVGDDKPYIRYEGKSGIPLQCEGLIKSGNWILTPESARNPFVTLY